MMIMLQLNKSGKGEVEIVIPTGACGNVTGKKNPYN